VLRKALGFGTDTGVSFLEGTNNNLAINERYRPGRLLRNGLFVKEKGGEKKK
jgi:hypothetical protein